MDARLRVQEEETAFVSGQRILSPSKGVLPNLTKRDEPT